MILVRLIAVTGCAALAGCAADQAKQPSLAAFPGVQGQVESFYDANATENDWSCNSPQMNSIDDYKIVSQSPRQVKMAIAYYFQSSDLQGLQADQCRGFNTRFFTFDKGAGGQLSLVSMSGPQRGQGG